MTQQWAPEFFFLKFSCSVRKKEERFAYAAGGGDDPLILEGSITFGLPVDDPDLNDTLATEAARER
jgi:hypothetical protein